MPRVHRLIFFAISFLNFSALAVAQFGTGAPVNQGSYENGPAPVRNMVGVWTRVDGPEGSFRSGSTWTPEPPALTPWGQERFATARDSNAGGFALGETNDPVLTRCYPPGVPRVYFHPYPFEVVYTPTQTIMLFEYDHMIRRIFTDGRENPEDPVALWLGNSVGRWTDDTTFVVTTVGIDERTWMDRAGYQHSDQLKVTEVFRRIDRLNMELDITLEDPIALAEPWAAETLYFRLAPPDWELSEISCSGDYLDFARFENFLEE